MTADKDLPAPLTPADCDLRDFPYMPLDVLRLRDSDLAAIQDAEAFRASVIAWCVSWHQVPAASLPDDDGMLCRLLGYGRDVKGWQRIRAVGGLHGWIRCSDGRLYHHVVAEKALDAWGKKQSQRERSRKGNAARWGSANASQKDAREIPQGSDDDPTGTPEPSQKDAVSVPVGVLGDPKGEGEREGEERIPLTPTADAAGGQGRSSIEKGRHPRGTRASGTNPRAVAAKARANAPPTPEPDSPLWPAFKARGMPVADFRHWIAPLTVVELNGRATVAAPSRFHADHVRAQFGPALEAALSRPIDLVVAA